MLKMKKNNSDIGEYKFQTNLRVIIWFVLILVLVGLGLVWVFYGRNAALFGFLCLLGAGIPAALIAIFLLGLDAIVKKSR
jgi:hypothetical protein